MSDLFSHAEPEATPDDASSPQHHLTSTPRPHTHTHPVPAGFEAETTAVFACDVLIEQPHPVETVRQKIFHQSDRKHKRLHKVTLFRNIEHFTV